MAFSAHISTKLTIAQRHFVAIFTEFHPDRSTNNKMIFALQKIVILSEPIFTELMLAQRSKLHENPTNSLIAVTVSRTEGHGLVTMWSYRTSHQWDASVLSRRVP